MLKRQHKQTNSLSSRSRRRGHRILPWPVAAAQLTANKLVLHDIIVGRFIYWLYQKRTNRQTMAGTIIPTHPDNFARLKCPPSTIICREKTLILGEVTIGPGCVVHPTARIIARNGPITIGSNNLIEERVNIINNFTEPMVIGDNNVFEVYSQCETRRMGSNNIIECKAFVGPEIELTDNCIIGAGCRLPDTPKLSQSEEQCQKEPLDVFKPNTEVYGKDLHRRVVRDLPASSHSSQLDFLRKILPNYSKLWRPANLLPATPPTNPR